MTNRRLSHHLSLRPRRNGRHQTVGEVGFTIIEVVVCVAILGVIVLPIALAFRAGFRVTEFTGASLNASTNRERVAYRFNTDVASVDATGASRSAATCDTSPSGGGSLLITLNTTTQPSASAVARRVSYWVTGSGVNISIARRACVGAVPGVAAGGGVETILAEKIGFPGANATDVVHGPYDPALAAMGSPCDEFRCQLEIDGRYRFRVTAQRRAFGAGVPLEVGKIYSSYDTRALLGPIVRYEHTTGTGASRGVEQRFTDQLTLAGGLDGTPQLYVAFAVQQKLTGLWLTCSTPGVYTTASCSFSAAAKTFVDGQYSAAVWKLPLKLGPSEVMAAGGEYRVYTQLKAGPSAPPKAYGGANGFPFWVDWYPQDSVFVKPGGSGTQDGLTPANAAPTVDAGLRISATQNRGEVQVADGNYNEAVWVAGASFADNRTVTGSHNPTTWLRGAKSPLNTKIQGLTIPTNGIGYRITGKKMQKFRQMSISSGTTPSLPGSSAWGMVIEGGATVFLNNSAVFSQPGRPGQNGNNAQPKGDGCLGGNGVGGSTAAVTNRVGAPVRTTTHNGVPFNVSGVPCVNASTADARWAGYGGGGGGSGLFYADPGARGGNGGGAPSAQGGNGGAGGFCDGKQGQPGGGGAIEPNTGNAGAPGSTPVWSGFAYAGVSGGAGFNGLNGHGGAGAGGAGATNCFGVNSAGSSGGSGGEGGLGGAGGGGGSFGGASIALMVDGAGSAVRLEDTQTLSGGGGRGGNGGRGGDGGYGGVGGRGGSNSGIIGENSGGGGGGSGGNGGGGGASGQGGVAYNVFQRGGGIARINSPISPASPLRGENGTPGSGGTGGAGGAGGLGGSSSITIFWIFTIYFGAPNGAGGSQGQPGSTGASPGLPPIGCQKGGVNGSNVHYCDQL